MWQNSNVFKVRIVLLLRIQMLFEKNNWKLWMWARVRECLHSNWHAQKFSNPNVHSVMLMLMLTVNKVYFSVGCCLFFRWNWAQILMYIQLLLLLWLSSGLVSKLSQLWAFAQTFVNFYNMIFVAILEVVPNSVPEAHWAHFRMYTLWYRA